MKNGEKLFDSKGNILHSHAGCIMYFEGYYYWYGQDIVGKNYVSCYRSKDLKNWDFRNAVLTADSEIKPSEESELTAIRRGFFRKKVNIERPKVIYCKKTKKYVMWAHYENGKDYKKACACVAVCDTPDGDFVYLGAFRPNGNMSRDCTLFEDGDKAYFISAANNNLDLKVYLLTDDFLHISREVATLFAGKEREAPTLFKKDGKIYILTSACTGWSPNQGQYSFADKIEGPWSALSNFGDKTTFDSQPTWVLEKDGRYIYIGDRWGGSGAKFLNSTYVFLNIEFKNNCPYIKFEKEFNI